MADQFDKKRSVRERYGSFANNSEPDHTGSLLDAEGRTSPEKIGYTEAEIESIPDGANTMLGCGTPLHYVDLEPGMTVLDLGCGGGIDCFLASGKVGESGKVIGIDMTPEMINRARRNAEEGNFINIEFMEGEAEELPLNDGTVDVIVSNCVFNLIEDKGAAFREAFRVLKIGGCVCFSDIVNTSEVPASLRKLPKAYTACLSGAVTPDRYRQLLSEAGFVDIETPVLRDWPFFKSFATIQVKAWKSK